MSFQFISKSDLIKATLRWRRQGRQRTTHDDLASKIKMVMLIYISTLFNPFHFGFGQFSDISGMEYDNPSYVWFENGWEKVAKVRSYANWAVFTECNSDEESETGKLKQFRSCCCTSSNAFSNPIFGVGFTCIGFVTYRKSLKLELNLLSCLWPTICKSKQLHTLNIKRNVYVCTKLFACIS